MIGKAKQPTWFQHKSTEYLGFYYRNKIKEWIKTKIFNDWIGSRDLDLHQSQEYCLHDLQIKSFVKKAAEEALILDLDTSQSLGLVHSNNCMSIKNLLNPVSEHTSGLEEWTLEETFRSFQEDEKQNEPTDKDPFPPPQPTQKDFLEVSETMLSYFWCTDSSEAPRYEKAIRAAVRHCRLICDKEVSQFTLLDFVCKHL